MDTKTIPPELEPLLKDYKGVKQESSKGYHYFFKFEADLPKTRIQQFLLDIENEGGQVVVFPSVVEGVSRRLTIDASIPTMSEKLKSFILNYVNLKNTSATLSSSQLPELT